MIDLDTSHSSSTRMRGFIARPRLIGDSVIFGDGGGAVREIDPVSLEAVGKPTVPDAVTNAVAFTADGRHVFGPTYMNEIYAFDRIFERVTHVDARTMG